VFLDGEFAFGLTEDQLYTLRLHKDDELTEKQLLEIEQTVLANSARRAAERQLARSMRTEKEVRKRLREKEFPQRVIDETIEWLIGCRFLDDPEYARSFIRTRMRLKPASRRMLRSELIRKGIRPEIADSALDELVEDDADSESASKLADKYIAQNRHIETRKLRNRLIGFLKRRGYSMSIIMGSLEKLNDDSQDDS